MTTQQKYILCDWGDAEIGKTEFLCKVDDLFKGLVLIGKMKELYRSKRGTKDRLVIYEDLETNKKYLIQTAGDPKSSAFKRTTNFLKKYDIHVLICANRMANTQSLQHIFAWQAEFEIITFQHPHFCNFNSNSSVIQNTIQKFSDTLFNIAISL